MSYEQSPAPVGKKGRGCLFYGCLTGIVLLLIAGIMVVVAIQYVRNLVNTYTDSGPMVMPKVELPVAEYEALEKRVAEFKECLDKSNGVPALILSGAEINALISNQPNASPLKDKFHISLEGDQIKGQVSIPLGDTHLPFTKGRYLNGAAAFKASLQNGVLIVTANSIEVKGKPLPEAFMSQLRSENLAKDYYRDPKNAETLRKIESFEIKDGKIIIKPRESQ